MKTKRDLGLFLSASLAVFFVVQPLRAAPKASKIGEFAGNYSGSVTLSQSGSGPFASTTRGTFKASKKKETGSLVLNSVFVSGGNAVPVQEQLTFRGRSMTYFLSSSGTSVTGFGSFRITEKTINYQATITSGGANIAVSGTIRRTKKRLAIDETLSSSLSAAFVYRLKRLGK